MEKYIILSNGMDKNDVELSKRLDKNSEKLSN